MRSVLKLAALVSSAAVLFGCATAPRVMSYFPTGAAPDEKIVWPGSAEVARIEFAGLLIGEQNFSQAEGSQDGAGIRLLRWIAGIGNRREEVRQLIRPQSGIVSIDDTHLPMPMAQMKTKSASFHWEFMFARSMHQTPDMIEQHRLLTWAAAEIDASRLRTTVSEVISPINAANLREAHRRIETGQAKGKIVLEGFAESA